MLVRAVVGHPQREWNRAWKFRRQPLEKLEKFRMPRPRLILADPFACRDLQGRKERGRAVAFVIGRHRAATPLLERQAHRRPIPSRDWTFLIHAQPHRFRGGLAIKSDAGGALRQALRTPGAFEGLGPVGLLVPLPAAVAGGLADARRFGPDATTPVGAPAGLVWNGAATRLAISAGVNGAWRPRPAAPAQRQAGP